MKKSVQKVRKPGSGDYRKWCKLIQEMSKLVLVVTNSEQEGSKSVQVKIRNNEVNMSVQEVRKSVQKVSNSAEES